MSDKVADRILAELPTFPCTVKYGEFEEPLMFPSLVEKLIFGLHVPSHVTTNGLLLDKYLDRAAGLDSVYVSIDAATAKTYKKVRGGDFAKVMGNVNALREKFRGSKLGVSFIRQPENQHEEQAFIDYWLPKVDCVIIYALLKFNDLSWSYDIPEPFLAPPRERFVCQNPFADTFILPNGDVTLCCETLLMSGREKVPVMGNILNESLQEIWNGANYNRVRAALTTKDYSKSPICGNCRIWASWRSEVSEAEGIRTTRNYTTKIVERIK